MTTDLPALYADLWWDYRETVPEGWALCGERGNPYPFLACHYLNSDNETATITFDFEHIPTWFFDLALKSIEKRLEAGGWYHSIDYDAKPMKRCWNNDCLGLGTRDHACPHRAAIDAYRMMKEQDDAD